MRVAVNGFKSLPNVPTCIFNYSPWPVLPHSTYQIVSNPYSILHKRFRDEVEERRKDTLWQTFAANTMVAKRCVRLRCTRRLRVSFREALKERGYNSDGTAIQKSGRGLTGSISLLATEPSLTTPFTELRNQMGLLVQFIEARLTTKHSRRVSTFGTGVGLGMRSKAKVAWSRPERQQG